MLLKNRVHIYSHISPFSKLGGKKENGSGKRENRGRGRAIYKEFLHKIFFYCTFKLRIPNLKIWSRESGVKQFLKIHLNCPVFVARLETSFC